MSNIEQIIAEIDGLEDIFFQCKSFFPALDNDLIGKNSFPTPSFYQARGYNVLIQTGNPITQDFIDRYAKIGKWLNENAIIRLYGIMDYYGFVTNIKNYHHIEGWEEVDLMRRMRNVFSKTILNYQPEDSDNIRLREELIDHFKLGQDQFLQNEIPTPIDKIVRPIFEGCRKFIRGRKIS